MLILFLVCRKSRGLSGRSLRKLPFIAQAVYVQVKKFIIDSSELYYVTKSSVHKKVVKNSYNAFVLSFQLFSTLKHST